MIFGDPDKFSIYIDVVEDWSSPSFLEGLFFYIVDRKFCSRAIPKNSSTLGVYAMDLCRMVNHLETISVENEKIFKLPIKESYKELNYLRFVPYEEYLETNRIEDYTYDIAIGEMSSTINEIYLVSYQNQEKILYKDLETEELFEYILEKGYVESIMKQVLDWWRKNYVLAPCKA